MTLEEIEKTWVEVGSMTLEEIEEEFEKMEKKRFRPIERYEILITTSRLKRNERVELLVNEIKQANLIDLTLPIEKQNIILWELFNKQSHKLNIDIKYEETFLNILKEIEEKK